MIGRIAISQLRYPADPDRMMVILMSGVDREMLMSIPMCAMTDVRCVLLLCGCAYSPSQSPRCL